MNDKFRNKTLTVNSLKDVNLDILRVVSCIAVIMVHTAGTGLLEGRSYDLGSFNWWVCMTYAALVRWCVPVFVMISGACFLNPHKSVGYGRLLKKNIFRILVALIAWSVFYSVVFHYPVLPLGGNSANHLWYLPMIIGMYLTVPILQQLPQKYLEYFTIIWFAFVSYKFIVRMTGAELFFSDIEHFFFSDYIGYFVLGYLLYSHDWTTKMMNMMKIVGLLAFFVTFFAAIYMSFNTNTTNQIYFSYFSPFVVLLSVSVFVLISKAKVFFTNKTLLNAITMLSACSFGIYLVHMFLLIELYTRIVRFIPNPLFFIPLICFVTFTSGFVIIYFIKRMPIVSRYIV